MELEKIIQRYELEYSQGVRGWDEVVNRMQNAIRQVERVERELTGMEQAAVRAGKSLVEAWLGPSRELQNLIGLLRQTKSEMDKIALASTRAGIRGVSRAELMARADDVAIAAGRPGGITSRTIRRMQTMGHDDLRRLVEAGEARVAESALERRIKNQMALAGDSRGASAAELRLLRAGRFGDLNRLSRGLGPAGSGGEGDSWYRRGAFAGLGSLFAGTAGGLVSSAGLPFAGGGMSTGGIAGSLLGSLVSPGIGTLAGAGIGTALGGLVGLPFDVISKGISALTAALEKLIGLGSSIVGFAVNTGMEFERLKVTFETMSGSVEKGQALFRQLQGLDVRSPFDLETLSRASNILLAAGTNSENVVGVLERLQDMAAGSSDRLLHLATDLERVTLTGRITAREMRAFATVGIGIKDLADTMGVDPSRIRYLMGRGQLGTGVLIDTFNRLTNPGGRFFGMTERFLGTVPGAWNQLVETTGQLAGKTATAGFERFGVAGGIRGITGFINRNEQAIIEGVLSALERVKVVGEEIWDVFQRVGVAVREAFGGTTLPSLESVRRVTRDLIQKITEYGKSAYDASIMIADGVKSAWDTTKGYLDTLREVYNVFRKIGDAVAVVQGRVEAVANAVGSVMDVGSTPFRWVSGKVAGLFGLGGGGSGGDAAGDNGVVGGASGGGGDFGFGRRLGMMQQILHQMERQKKELQRIGWLPKDGQTTENRQDIQKEPAVEPAALQFANRIRGQLESQGRSPLDRFNIEMGLIQEALRPASGANPVFDIMEARAARYQTFQTLREATGFGKPIQTAPAALRDSMEAASIIASNQVREMDRGTTEEEILAVLKAAAAQRERTILAEEKTNVILDKIYNRPAVLPPVVKPER